MSETHAMVIRETGGPDVLRWEAVALAAPATGEVRVRHTAVGLNFIDTYHRTGLYPVPLPAILGSEGAGVVEAVGEGVGDIAVGDRVAYATGPLGSYAEARNIPAAFVVKVPADVDDRTAAAVMLKGMTAHYLVEIGGLRQKRQSVVVHAAAGGVGLLLCQWAKRAGATVIGSVGSDEKATLARAHGCDHVIVTGRGATPDLADRIQEANGGAKVDVVYDSVGKDTFTSSIAALRPRGLLVAFGQSSGAVPPFEIRMLSAGSLFLTRPKLGDYTATREELDMRARELFLAIASKELSVRVDQTYPLRDAVRAHRDLEGRKTTGATVLVP